VHPLLRLDEIVQPRRQKIFETRLSLCLSYKIE
jgi:hypothetical protein